MAPKPIPMRADEGPQRLDKWLWFARVIKSRTQAAALISDGKVRVNRERATKPSEHVRAGDVVTLAVHARLRVLRVRGPGLRRGPPAEAAALYEDLSPPAPLPEARPPAHAVRPPGTGRPTKRERRAIEKLTGET